MSSNTSNFNSDLENSYKVIKIQKAFKKTFVESPPQTKVLISFLIPLFVGFIVYSFINTPVTQLIVFSVIALLFGLLLYSFGSNYAEKWGIMTAFLTGTCYWIYVFINKYRKQQSDLDIGKKIFICNPNGVCDTDGVKGPYNGEDKYVFSPPSKPDEKYNYIPKNQFDIRISDQFTYMFWIKIDYSRWINSSFYGRDKIILMKGNNIGTSDLAVWALPVNEALQFDIGTNIPNQPVSLSTNFSFDKWIHYAVVVNNKVVELYKNATLEKSALMSGTFTLKNTPLYLGRTPYNSDYDKFPGQILYLSYNNSNLLPSYIYDIYQKEYSNISKFAEDINNNLDEPQNISNNCVNSNSRGNQNLFGEDSNFQSMILTDAQGIEYQQGQPITLPSEIIKNSEIISKYQKIINNDLHL